MRRKMHKPTLSKNSSGINSSTISSSMNGLFGKHVSKQYKMIGAWIVLLIAALSCNLPSRTLSQENSGEEMVSTIGSEGGTVSGSGNVELVVPEGAFSQPVEINLSVGGSLPTPPEPTDIEIAGEPVKVTLPEGVEYNGVFELAIPFERQASTSDDRYSVLKWDGSHWQTAGGLVEGDRIRVRINGFSTF